MWVGRMGYVWKKETPLINSLWRNLGHYLIHTQIPSDVPSLSGSSDRRGTKTKGTYTVVKTTDIGRRLGKTEQLSISFPDLLLVVVLFTFGQLCTYVFMCVYIFTCVCVLVFVYMHMCAYVWITQTFMVQKLFRQVLCRSKNWTQKHL
jgi:hypothetical protein